MRRWELLIYILILSALSMIVFAEEYDVIKLDEIIVSATRTQSSLDKVSASSSVITEKQINDSNANDVGDLLGETNIVQMLDYGPASVASASLRGSTAAQVLVLIDGRRINDSRAGGADLDGISTANIERIEIIKGGQSAMYGADAVGGIINIITKRPQKLNAKVWSNFGSYGLRSFGLEASEQTKYLSGTFSLSKTDSESDFPFQNRFGENLIRKNANYDRRNVYAKVSLDALKSAILDLSASHYYSDSGSPGLIGFYTPEAVKRDKTNDISLNFEHEPISSFSYKIIAYNRMSVMRYIDPTYPYSSDDTHKNNVKSAEIQTHLLKTTKMPIVSGVQFMDEDINSTAVENRLRQTFSLYAQQELRKDINIDYLKAVSIFPAVRWDHYSDFDAGLSPKIGVLASLNDILTIRANAGKSYRAPTMNDLYWPSSAMTSGNPNLRPERSTDADAGFQIHIQRSPKNIGISLIRCGATYFQSNITDGIQWTPGRNDKWTPLNFAKIDTKGAETDAHVSLSFLNLPDFVSINGNYTFLNSKDALGRQMMYHPKHSIGYTARLGVDNLWFQASGTYQSKRYYTAENTKWLDPFMRHDFQIGIERRLWNSAKIGLSVDLKNAFNKQYQLIPDYPLPGREWSFKTYIKGE